MFKKTISFLISILIALSLTPALALDAESLIPIGHTTGIKMFSDGIIVVDTTEIETKNGSKNPCADAGITEGDVIVKLNDIMVNKNEDFSSIVKKNGAKPIKVTVLRGGKEHEVNVTPICDLNGDCKLGLWIRDSMAGIGTITFYDPKTNTFGALGHGICDSDTNVLIPFKSGSVMESSVADVKRGSAGAPGELVGDYNLKSDCGTLLNNTNAGIFGNISKDLTYLNRKSIPVAQKSEIKTGPAVILSNVDGNNVSEYKIEITKIYPDNAGDTKNMMIRVTDKDLISKTGGIVQGMSGSPILQNGRIVGAVTHVFVNDPTRGYGIFIENMLAEAEKIKSNFESKPDGVYRGVLFSVTGKLEFLS